MSREGPEEDCPVSGCDQRIAALGKRTHCRRSGCFHYRPELAIGSVSTLRKSRGLQQKVRFGSENLNGHFRLPMTVLKATGIPRKLDAR